MPTIEIEGINETFEFPEGTPENVINDSVQKFISDRKTDDRAPFSLLSKRADAAERSVIKDIKQSGTFKLLKKAGLVKEDFLEKKLEIDQLKALQKAGLLEGVDLNKKLTSRLITAAQIGTSLLAPQAKVASIIGKAGIRALPTAIEASGQFGQSLLKGDSVDTAKKKALKSGVTSGILDVAGIGVFKVLKSGAARKFNKSVVSRIKENPLIIKTKKDIDDVSEKGFDAIKRLKDRAGLAVGRAKKEAAKTGKLVNVDGTVNFLNRAEKKAGLIVEKGGVPIRGERGAKVFNEIEEILTAPAKPTVKNASNMLESIDNTLEPTFDRIADGKAITNAERLALRVRDNLNKQIFKALDVSSKGLKVANKEFKTIAELLDSSVLKNAKRSEKKLASAIKTSMKKGSRADFNKLKKLDDILPKRDKFLDDAVGGVVNDGLGKISASLSGARGTAEAVSKVLIRPTAQTALRRAAVETVAEPIETAETVRRIPEQVRSLNSVVFGQK